MKGSFLMMLGLLWVLGDIWGEGLEFPRLKEALEKISLESSSKRYKVELEDALLFWGKASINGKSHVSSFPLELTLEQNSEGWSVTKLGSSHLPLQQRLRVSDIVIESQVKKAGEWFLKLAWKLGRRTIGREMGQFEIGSRRGAKNFDWSIGGKNRVADTQHRLEIIFSEVEEGLSLSLYMKGAVSKQTLSPMPTPLPDDETKVFLDEVDQYFTGTSAQDLELELVFESGVMKLEKMISPGWNQGLHRLGQSRVELEQGRIEGQFDVLFQKDPRIPADGQEKKMTYEILLEEKDGWKGSYVGEGSWPRRKGEVLAKGGKVLKGRYRLEGVDGSREGKLIGRGGLVRVEKRTDARSTLLKMLGEVLDPSAPLVHSWEPSRYEKSYVEVMEKQALSLLSDGWRTQAPPQEQKPGLMGTQQADSLKNGEVPVLKEKPFSWFRPTNWRVLGPFVQKSVSESIVAPLLPELVHGGHDNTIFVDTRLELGEAVNETKRWVPALEKERSVFLPKDMEGSLWLTQSRLSSKGEHPLPLAFRSLEMKKRSAVWFASTTLKIEKEKVYWLALRGREKVGLYLDGQRIFTSRQRGDEMRFHLLPLQLEEGEHQILFRVGRDNLDYHPKASQSQSSFQFFIGNGYLSEPLKIRKPPEVEMSGVGSPLLEDEGGSLPFAFDENHGVNKAWSTPLRSGKNSPVILEDRMVLTSWEGWVEARDLSHGRLLWEKQISGRSRPSTPAVLDDGVVVHFAPGALARLSRDGQVLWKVSTGNPNRKGSPPLVVGNIVLVQIVEELIGEEGSERSSLGQRLQARSLETGELIWEQKLLGSSVGIVPVLPPGGAPLVVTASGQVFDVSKGKKFPWLLLEGCRPESEQGDVTARENVVYFGSSSGQWAFSFREGASGLEVQDVFSQGRHPGGVTSSIKLHGEELWVSRRELGADGFVYLDVYDAKNGQHLARLNPFPGSSYQEVKWLSRGEQLLMVGLGGSPVGRRVKTSSARLAVVQGGDEPQVIYRHEFRAGSELVSEPVAANGQLSFRFDDRLLSLRFTKGGVAYQREALARKLLSDLGKPPEVAEVLLPISRQKTVGPIFKISQGPSPSRWWQSGPYAKKELALVDQRSWVQGLVEGGSWSGPGPFVPTAEGVVSSRKLMRTELNGQKFFVPLYQINLSDATGGQAQSVTYFQACLEVSERGFFRMESPSRYAEVALGSERLMSRDVMELNPGFYPLIVKANVGQVPRLGRMLLNVQFIKIEDPKALFESWLQKVAHQKKKLEDIVSEFEKSELGLEAQGILGYLGKKQE